MKIDPFRIFKSLPSEMINKSSSKTVNKSETKIIDPSIVGNISDWISGDFKNLSNEKILEYFLCVPQLFEVITTGANMFSNMNLRTEDFKGVEVVNNYSRLMAKPNFHQSQKEYLVQAYVFGALYGNEYEYGLKSVGFDFPSQINSLDPSRLTCENTSTYIEPLFLQSEMPDFNYIFQDDRKSYKIPSKDILHINNPAKSQKSFKDSITGYSKVSSLVQALDNIIGAYESRGMLIHHRGALGILSNASKDAVGQQTLDSGDKDQLQKDYQKFGLNKGQWSLLMTNLPLSYQNMAMSTKELMLFEEIEDDFQVICGVFGMDREIFPTVKGTTYENKDQAIKSTYVNTIIPKANEWTAARDNFYENETFKTVADYSHLPVFDEDLKQRGIALKQNTDALDKAYLSKAISLKTYQDEMEFMLTRNRK